MKLKFDKPLVIEGEKSNDERRTDSTTASNLTIHNAKHSLTVEPRQMRYADIRRATTTSLETLKADPVNQYLQYTPDYTDTPLQRAYQRRGHDLSWLRYVNKKDAWTINAGEAIVAFTKPSKKRTPSGKVLDRLILNTVALLGKVFKTPEQKKRHKEIQTKLRGKIEELIGERKSDMVYLDVIATTPAKQGRGYGTALAKLVTSAADAEGRGAYLESSNVKMNTKFYNSLGFFTVGEIVLGDTNPTWNEPPVVVAIMVRDPPSKENFDDKRLTSLYSSENDV